MKIFAICAVLLIETGSTSAMATSFDCSKAKSPTEKAICNVASLSDLDTYLDRYYVVALEALKDGASCLKQDQRRWVKSVRNACGKDVACLTNAHLARLAVLDGLQPGASALKNVELPKGPVLVAAIPAEVETIASVSKKPFELSGHLLHEIQDPNAMGLAVKPDKGRVRAFVYEISYGNSANHQVISDLIESGTKDRFLVRGLLSEQGGFSDGDCRFVYRLADL